jgi:hypothetical protein
MLSVTCKPYLSVIMVNVFMLSVIMLSVIIMSVVVRNNVKYNCKSICNINGLSIPPSKSLAQLEVNLG